MDTDCHLRILKEKRVYLVGNLDLTGTLVLDQLVQDGVLSADQLKAMTDRCDTNLRLASELVRHLEHRPKGDWDTFLRCLKDHNHDHVVKHISHNVEAEVLDDGISDLIQLIAAIMLEHYNKIPVWTLHSDHITVPMDERFVDLKLVKDEKHRNCEGILLDSYKDILRKSTGRSTIYLTGEPGAGKSTLTKRMCVDWATLIKNDNSSTPPDDIMGSYQFVLALCLRAVRTGDAFCQVISNEYQLRQYEAITLCRCIENTKKPVLIIVDGLDEYDESTSTEITEIIHRKRLQHVTLFITSRHPSDSVFSSDDFGPGIQVILKGFSEEGVMEYISKFFDENKDEGDALLHEIKQSKNLEHLSHIPAVLLMMATLWQENRQLASTLSGFYEDFVACIFARFEKKQKLVKTERATSKMNLIKKYHAKIMDLGKLAGSSKKIPLTLNFHDADVIKYINQDDLRIGFLLEKQTFSGEICYMYTHKTVQEFFFAFYLVNSDRVTQKSGLMRLCRIGAGNWGMIRRFLVGIAGEKMLKQIMAMVRNVKSDRRRIGATQTRAQLEYLAEHPDKHARLELPRYLYLDYENVYLASLQKKYLSQDGRNTIRAKIESYDETYIHLLQHLHAPGLTSLTLAEAGVEPQTDIRDISQTLAGTLGKFPLKSLLLSGISQLHGISDILKAVVGKLNLHTLFIAGVCLTEDQVHTLKTWLPTSELGLLGMAKIRQKWAMTMIEFIPRTLTRLDIRACSLCGLSGMTQKVNAVKHSCLQTVRMSNCRLKKSDMVALFTAVPLSLHKLIINNNDFSGLSDSEISLVNHSYLHSPRKRRRINEPSADHLASLTRSNLQLLNISQCKLKSRDVIAVILSLPDTLTDLDVSENSLGEEGGLKGLVDTADQIKTLKRLNLSNCNIPSHMAKNIKHQLGVACPQLSLELLGSDDDTSTYVTTDDDATDSDFSTDTDDATDSDVSTDTHDATDSDVSTDTHVATDIDVSTDTHDATESDEATDSDSTNYDYCFEQEISEYY